MTTSKRSLEIFRVNLLTVSWLHRLVFHGWVDRLMDSHILVTRLGDEVLDG